MQSSVLILIAVASAALITTPVLATMALWSQPGSMVAGMHGGTAMDPSQCTALMQGTMAQHHAAMGGMPSDPAHCQAMMGR